ncbi:MAG TPA: hypothetical protein VFS31_19590 [Chitinophagaceae bacterium]|jgi:hypothetical protein|nr:hypothetical protein [Chitinophagaceae bacterium]
MNTKVSVNLHPVQDNELKELLKETRETIATGAQKEIISAKTKQFSAADMWNLHRKQRFTADMRRRLN